MIYYEVNLEIDTTIYKDFLIWLYEHINEMLCFHGFKKAQVYEDETGTSTRKICVHYELDNLEDLHTYFENHATRMREKAKNLFGDQVTATRRILKLNKIF